MNVKLKIKDSVDMWDSKKAKSRYESLYQKLQKSQGDDVG